MRSLPRRFLLPLLATLLLLVGCGGRINRGGTISGKVTIDGAPVTAGNVLFVSADGQLTAIGPIAGDGSYTVKEPPLGNVSIAVQTEQFRKRAPPAKHSAPGGPPNKDAGSPGMVLPKPSERGLVYKATPKKYEQADTSGLRHVVERGNTTHDIELTEK